MSVIKDVFSGISERFRARNVPLKYVKRDGYIVVEGYREGLTPRAEVPGEILGLPVREIAPRSFIRCPFLYEMYIRDGVEIVGANAFSSCELLALVHMDDSVRVIGKNAFSECEDLFCADLSRTLDEIDDRAFCGCTGLRDITLPDSLRRIGERAFFGCKLLKSVKIPVNLKEIYRSTFENCPELSDIFIERGSPADRVLSQSEYYSKKLRYVPRI